MPGIRPNIKSIKPYEPGKPIEEVKRELGLTEVVKLASNENPLGPSPKAIQAVVEAAQQMHLYPDGSSHLLRGALAKHYGLPYDQILVGNGSDELITLIGRIFLGSPQDELLMGDPSFPRYDAAAQLAPSKLVKVRLDSEYRHDLPAMAKAVNENTSLVFIANPNNPTGTIVRRKELDRFVADLPAHVTLVLDEAYAEFAMHEPSFPSSLDYLKEGRNVIGLRTFSKAYGLAGIRVGYGFASPEVVDAINRAREPFDANSLAQAAAIAALGDDAHVKATAQNNLEGLQLLADAFEAVGARPYESFANFLLADMGRPAEPIFKELLKKGVITRAGRQVGDVNCLRVSVGTQKELEVFAKALKEVCG